MKLEREARDGDARPERRMLISDIDGTLLEEGEPTAGLDTLRRILVTSRGVSVKLVYATGRTVDSTVELIDREVLPRPDAIASLVGTEIWLPPFDRAHPGYARQLADGWDRWAAVEIAERFAHALAPQPAVYQGRFKVSYFVDDDSVLPEIERALAERGVAARLVYSCGRYLDIMPRSSGKRAAGEYLAALWGISPEHVLAAGDSGNDADILAHPRYTGVAVGNAEPELAPLTSLPNVHRASLPHAAGVLEGAAAHRFWG